MPPVHPASDLNWKEALTSLVSTLFDNTTFWRLHQEQSEDCGNIEAPNNKSETDPKP
jgi:hypothetical protein